jgi:hypothetical protein
MRDMTIRLCRYEPKRPGGPTTADANVAEIADWIADGWIIAVPGLTLRFTKEPGNPDVVQTETVEVSPFEYSHWVKQGWHLWSFGTQTQLPKRPVGRPKKV